LNRDVRLRAIGLGGRAANAFRNVTSGSRRF
jgi:hypothetical protein